MKKIFLCLLLMSILTSCNFTPQYKDNEQSKTMNILEDTAMTTIYIDTTTGVQYFSRDQGGIIRLDNPDGTPKIHKDFIKQAKETNEEQKAIQNNINIVNN